MVSARKINSVKGSRRWHRNTSKTAILRAADKGYLTERRIRLARTLQYDFNCQLRVDAVSPGIGQQN
jgi:hypothetical protein